LLVGELAVRILEFPLLKMSISQSPLAFRDIISRRIYFQSDNLKNLKCKGEKTW